MSHYMMFHDFHSSYTRLLFTIRRLVNNWSYLFRFIVCSNNKLLLHQFLLFVRPNIDSNNGAFIIKLHRRECAIVMILLWCWLILWALWQVKIVCLWIFNLELFLFLRSCKLFISMSIPLVNRLPYPLVFRYSILRTRMNCLLTWLFLCLILHINSGRLKSDYDISLVIVSTVNHRLRSVKN